MVSVDIRQRRRVAVDDEPDAVFGAFPEDAILLRWIDGIDRVDAEPDGRWRLLGPAERALGFTIEPNLVVDVTRDLEDRTLRIATDGSHRLDLDVDVAVVANGAAGSVVDLDVTATAHLAIPSLLAGPVRRFLAERARGQADAVAQEMARHLGGRVVGPGSADLSADSPAT